MTRPHGAQTPRIEAWIREHKSDMTEHFFLASTEIMRQLERELQAERERGRRLVGALREIEEWRFDIRGDCVADARHVARQALALSRAESAPADVPTVREE